MPKRKHTLRRKVDLIIAGKTQEEISEAIREVHAEGRVRSWDEFASHVNARLGTRFTGAIVCARAFRMKLRLPSSSEPTHVP